MPSNNKLFGFLVVTLVVLISLFYTNNLQIHFFSSAYTTSAIITTTTTTSGTTTTKMDLKSYIITLKDDISEIDLNSIKSVINRLGGEITKEYSLIKGFAVKLPSLEIGSLNNDERVVTIEEDKEAHIL